MELNDLCQEIIIIARKAGDFITEEASGFDIGITEVKGLNDFISYVDLDVEIMLVDNFGKLEYPKLIFPAFLKCK